MAVAPTIEDRFNRADGALGSLWSVVTGALAVVQQSAKQTSVVSLTSTAEATDTLSFPEQEAEVHAAFSASGGSPYAAVFLRQDPDTAGHRYEVRIVLLSDTTAKVQLVKKVSGTPTVLAETPVATPIPIALNKFVRLRGRIEERDGKTTLTAFVDQTFRHHLTVTDQAPPTWTREGKIGFEVFEGTGAASPRVTIDGFFASIFENRPSVLVARSVPKAKWTLATMAQRSLEMTERGSEPDYDLTFYKDALNFTEQEIVDLEGYWWWCEEEVDFPTVSGVADYEAPEDANILSQIKNPGANEVLDGMDERLMANAIPNRETGSGSPRRWTTWGRNPHDAPIIHIYPASDGSMLRLLYYRRGGLMEADDDLPLVPQRYVEALLWGAVLRATERDTDPRFYKQAEARFLRWVAVMRAAHRRMRVSGKRTVLRHALRVARWKRRALLPVRRIDSFED